jgi:hypothetical protein
MIREEMPIFTRSFDLLSWLLPATNHFPKSHRHSFTRRLLDAAFDLREFLEAPSCVAWRLLHQQLQERPVRLSQQERSASRGKRRHHNVAAFEHHLEDQLAALRRELIERTYRPGPYSSFHIRNLRT